MDSLQTERGNPEKELTPLIIKARCPACFKLYAIDAEEIQDSKPQFACSKCQTQFWFAFPEALEQKEVLGFPVEWLNPVPAAAAGAVAPSSEGSVATDIVAAARMFNCPRCQAQYSAGDTECPKCGVVFSKLALVEDSPSIASSPALRRLWHQVMDSYEKPEMHRKFIQTAQREGNLLFASHQYRRLLNAHSGDETALKMQREIVALTEAVQGVASSSISFKPMKLMPRMTTVILMCGGGLIAFGFMVPAARNVIGLGVALVFFTMAARWLIDRQ